MAVNCGRVFVPSQRRESLMALRDLARSVEDRISECRPEDALREWGHCVAGNLNLWISAMEQKISEDGE
jgi:hypothetical protein